MDYNKEYNSADYEFCRPFFTADEYVIWRGRPSRKIMGADIALIPFGLFFSGFAIFWMFMWFSMGGGPEGFVGLIFFFVGIFVIFSGIIKRKSTYYVLTNHKIYRKSSKKIDMLDLANLPPMRVVAYKNGYGSILFGEYQYRSNGKTHNGVTFSLDNIPDVANVQRIISDML